MSAARNQNTSLIAADSSHRLLLAFFKLPNSPVPAIKPQFIHFRLPKVYISAPRRENVIACLSYTVPIKSTTALPLPYPFAHIPPHRRDYAPPPAPPPTETPESPRDALPKMPGQNEKEVVASKDQVDGTSSSPRPVPPCLTPSIAPRAPPRWESGT